AISVIDKPADEPRCEPHQIAGQEAAPQVIDEAFALSARLKTTMIYTHCVPVRTVKEPKSPLDL
ncbi:MAG: hypothetical protein Q7W05_11035, partial [Deltaproteobacteria bacterium]|nr:hypothetical protein [Deltaproteobacteria bacterium]